MVCVIGGGGGGEEWKKGMNGKRMESYGIEKLFTKLHHVLQKKRYKGKKPLGKGRKVRVKGVTGVVDPENSERGSRKHFGESTALFHTHHT